MKLNKWVQRWKQDKGLTFHTTQNSGAELPEDVVDGVSLDEVKNRLN